MCFLIIKWINETGRSKPSESYKIKYDVILDNTRHQKHYPNFFNENHAIVAWLIDEQKMGFYPVKSILTNEIKIGAIVGIHNS